MLSLRAGVVVALLAISSWAQARGGTGDRSVYTRPLKLFHPKPSPRGTILMFHGFSAGPAQWHAEAEFRFKQGYDVIITTLPGHGYHDAAGNEDLSRLPTARQASRYTKFAQASFDAARARSDKLHVIGFSVGGAHALEVALANRGAKAADGSSVIRSVVAVNPYLSATPNKVLGISMDRLGSTADRLTHGLSTRLLAARQYVFKSAVRKVQVGETDVGFTHASLGHLFAIGRFGDQVREHAEAVAREGGLKLPAHIVVSERDGTADPKASLRLADQIGARKTVLQTDKHNPFLWRTSSEAAALKIRLQVHHAISDALTDAERPDPPAAP